MNSLLNGLSNIYNNIHKKLYTLSDASVKADVETYKTEHFLTKPHFKPYFNMSMGEQTLTLCDDYKLCLAKIITPYLNYIGSLTNIVIQYACTPYIGNNCEYTFEVKQI